MLALESRATIMLNLGFTCSIGSELGFPLYCHHWRRKSVTFSHYKSKARMVLCCIATTTKPMAHCCLVTRLPIEFRCNAAGSIFQ